MDIKMIGGFIQQQYLGFGIGDNCKHYTTLQTILSKMWISERISKTNLLTS